jgi:hypothetical protein
MSVCTHHRIEFTGTNDISYWLPHLVFQEKTFVVNYVILYGATQKCGEINSEMV